MKKIAIGMVIAVAAVSMMAVSPVYAQDVNPPDRPGRMGGRGSAGSEITGGRGAAGSGMTTAGRQDLASVAETLGISLEELQAELQAGNTVRDLMDAAGIVPDWAQEFQYDYSADRQAYLADKLGMSLEELQAALDAGATVHDLAEAAGIEVPLWGDDWMHGRAEDGLAGGIGQMAEALGMAVEELEAAVAAGSTIHDLFEAAGLDFPMGGAMGGGMNRGGR
jgi:hypothetical protein